MRRLEVAHTDGFGQAFLVQGLEGAPGLVPHVAVFLGDSKNTFRVYCLDIRRFEESLNN